MAQTVSRGCLLLTNWRRWTPKRCPSAELVDLDLSRIDEYNTPLNAIVPIDADAARRAAPEADAARVMRSYWDQTKWGSKRWGRPGETAPPSSSQHHSQKFSAITAYRRDIKRPIW